MPYIPLERRKDVLLNGAKNAGELNFFITTVLRQYMEEKGIKYQTFNDIIGALEGAKMELYERKIRPYEDVKMIKNGDVY